MRRAALTTLAVVSVWMLVTTCTDSNTTSGPPAHVYVCQDDSSWIADTQVVRAILDSNGLGEVGYHLVSSFDTCGRVVKLDLSTINLCSLVGCFGGPLVSRLPSIVSRLTNLRALLVTNEPIDSLPSSIGSLKNLDTLEAQNCGLRRLPDTITTIDSLKLLYLTGNQLTNLPDSFGRLVNLVVLELGNNDLDSLPLSITSLQHLSPDHFSVSGNRLCTVPAAIAAWLAATTYEGAGWGNAQIGCLLTIADTLAVRRALDAQGLTTVGVAQVAIIERGRVVSLDLSGEGLTAIPPTVLQLTGLVRLDLSNNAITSIPAGIDSLHQLDTLDLSHNRIASIDSLVGLNQLRALDLSHNALTTVPEGRLQMDSLRVLNLSSNALDSLAVFAWIPDANLTTVLLADNDIEVLPGLGQLHALQSLDITHNMITALPSLNGLVSLQRLLADSNPLPSLPPLDSLRWSLRVLDVAYDSLDSLPVSIGLLDSLDTLDFRNNQIATLPPELSRLSGVWAVYADGNHLCTRVNPWAAWLDLHAEPKWDSSQVCP